MNENEVMQEAPVQEQVMVQQVIPEASDKRGMTTGQKLAGLGLIGFAIAGIAWLVTATVKAVKKVVAKIKTPKEAPAQQVAVPAATQEPAPTETRTEAPEQSN